MLLRRFLPLALLAGLSAYAAPEALAGYGVQPIGQTIQVQIGPSGYISEPARLEFIVYLDGQDSSPYVWVSPSQGMSSYGTPTGGTVGACSPSGFRSWIEQNKYVCSISTILMAPGTYYWWLDFQRRESSTDLFPQQRVSGPFAFTLAQAPPPAAPAPVAQPGSEEPEVEQTVSTATAGSASTLRSSDVFDGVTSVKHTRLTQVVYRTMKVWTRPKLLAIACWAEDDWQSVLDDLGAPPDGDVTTLGVWRYAQPRWLHLAPQVCERIQALLESEVPNAPRADALSTALHEALHAYGINQERYGAAAEAMANCYAVQLVPTAAFSAGLTWKRSLYAGQLAVRSVRRAAPPGYWNGANCRDGGRWDLIPSRVNLR